MPDRKKYLLRLEFLLPSSVVSTCCLFLFRISQIYQCMIGFTGMMLSDFLKSDIYLLFWFWVLSCLIFLFFCYDFPPFVSKNSIKRSLDYAKCLFIYLSLFFNFELLVMVFSPGHVPLDLWVKIALNYHCLGYAKGLFIYLFLTINFLLFFFFKGLCLPKCESKLVKF